jgi:hypothetical protein
MCECVCSGRLITHACVLCLPTAWGLHVYLCVWDLGCSAQHPGLCYLGSASYTLGSSSDSPVHASDLSDLWFLVPQVEQLH